MWLKSICRGSLLIWILSVDGLSLLFELKGPLTNESEPAAESFESSVSGSAKESKETVKQ